VPDLSGTEMMRTVAVACLLAVLLPAAACGSRRSEPALGTITDVRTTADIVLPLDAYAPNPDQQRTLATAYQRLIHECGSRFGFDVPVAVAPSDVANLTEHDRLYGILRIEDATRFGYRVPTGAAPLAPSGKSGSGWNPSDDEFVVVRGVDRNTGKPKTGTLIHGQPVAAGGCAGQASRSLAYGTRGSPPPDLAKVYERLSVEAHRSAERDSRVRAGFASWSACMARAGYRYGSPWEPNDARWGQAVTPQEIATATADVRCRQDTRLVDTWVAVESAYQRRLIAEHRDELAQARRNLDVRLRNAATAVG
jgi:hypothetical protein